MRPIHDRPIDRAARRTITLCIVGGALVGTILGATRYGLLAIGTVGLAGLGTMVALGVYAAVVALKPSTVLEESDADLPPP
jgi:hypothetical protein